MTAPQQPTSARDILAGPCINSVIAHPLMSAPIVIAEPLQFLPVHSDPQGAFVGTPVSQSPHLMAGRG